MSDDFETKMWLYKKMGDSKETAYLKALEASARSTDYKESVESGKSETDVAIVSSRIELALIVGILQINSKKIVIRLNAIIILLVIGLCILLFQ